MKENTSNLNNVDLLINQKSILDVFVKNGFLSETEYKESLFNLINKMVLPKNLIEEASNLGKPIHTMKLNKEPFKNMKSGLKTVELRLNDEKRKRIKISDLIVFYEIDGSGIIYAVVTGLSVFASFKELYQQFTATELGYLSNEAKNPEDMRAFYSAREEKENGVLGISLYII